MAARKPESAHRRAGTSFRSDLGLELYRQHTLLAMMAARMRESSDALARNRRVDPVRLRRALEVHRQYLLSVHQANEKRVLDALEGSSDASVQKAIQDCRAEHARSEQFQNDAAKLMEDSTRSSEDRAIQLSRLLRSEASRVEEHHAKEEQRLYRQLDRLLSAEVLGRLLQEIRLFDNRRINAEIQLTAWAAELHPSSD